jgi:hypothetical protein
MDKDIYEGVNKLGMAWCSRNWQRSAPTSRV